jgi:hypothetical protein
MSDVADRVQKTFDDTYGKHALVIPEGWHGVDPSSGQVDVVVILEKNGGARLHPVRVAPGYVGTHRKVVR